MIHDSLVKKFIDEEWSGMAIVKNKRMTKNLWFEVIGALVFE